MRYSVAALLTNPVSSSTQPQGIISNTPQKSVGCLRLCLRLCLRVAKIRTFAPLLVPLRCAGTIALLSDFCSAGWRLPPPFACLGFRSRTQKYAPSFSNLKEHARGPRKVSERAIAREDTLWGVPASPHCVWALYFKHCPAPSFLCEAGLTGERERV